MRKNIIIALAIVSSSLFFASRAMAADVDLSTDEQKFSYGIGIQIGLSLAQQAIKVDQDALLLAVKDALNGIDSRVPLDELQRVMKVHEKKLQEQHAASSNKNVEIGKAFLAENKKLDGIITTDSGLQYRIVKAGTGVSPKMTDTVTVHYRGTLIDGTEFDSSYKREQPATFPLTGIIKGWQEALPMMKEGDKWEIFVPSTLAYGPKGASGTIGPNETLIFEIELLSVDKPNRGE